jgi:hypothetical protein
MKTLLKRLWSESAVAPCARPQDYLYEIDESFFTLFVGHEVIGGEIDRCLLNRVCDVAYREAIAFQVNLMDRDQAIEFIRTLLVKCDSLLSGKFFVSSCFALRLRDSFVVATIGRCESWLLHAHTVNRLTTNTILAGVPGVFLSVLGGTVPILNANIQVAPVICGSQIIVTTSRASHNRDDQTAVNPIIAQLNETKLSTDFKRSAETSLATALLNLD